MRATRRLQTITPGAVWAVLSDPSSYPAWLAGVDEVVDFEPQWPAQGSRFRHRYRWGPITLTGSATVEAQHPPSHIRLRVKRRPFSVSIVELRLRGTDADTEIDLDELRSIGVGPAPFNYLEAGYAQARNQESLKHLERRAAKVQQADSGVQP